jgi:hypothetical protein
LDKTVRRRRSRMKPSVTCGDGSVKAYIHLARQPMDCFTKQQVRRVRHVPIP